MHKQFTGYGDCQKTAKTLDIIHRTTMMTLCIAGLI